MSEFKTPCFVEEVIDTKHLKLSCEVNGKLTNGRVIINILKLESSDESGFIYKVNSTGGVYKLDKLY